MKNTFASCLVVLALGAPAFAQEPVPPPPAPEQQAPPQAAAPLALPPVAVQKPVNMADMRHHIYVMEGALARAVDYGVKQLNRQILDVMPGVLMLEGEARARGLYLDAYGVFFDVSVPTMRQSVVWSVRVMMDQNQQANEAAINDLRRSMQGVTDPNTRASIERAVRQLEGQIAAAMPRNQQITPGLVMPDGSMPAVGSATAAGMVAPRAASPAADPWAKDPNYVNRAYTEAVTRALVDAMIDYSTPMAIPADQWLTVAARDDEGRDSLAPQDPLEEVFTMIYRIKGSDLQMYRTGKIDRDEVRKRVQLSQF